MAELPYTVHSCGWHGVIAARLNSERPGTVTPLLKNIDPIRSTIITSVTLEVFKRDKKGLMVRAQCYPA